MSVDPRVIEEVRRAIGRGEGISSHLARELLSGLIAAEMELGRLGMMVMSTRAWTRETKAALEEDAHGGFLDRLVRLFYRPKSHKEKPIVERKG